MKKFKYMMLAAVAALSLGFTACNDDDEYFDDKYQDQKIVVNRVYLEDYKSSVPDREVTFARLGQTIRLEGSGFMGLKKVYINGFDTYFNRAYISDGSMLISLKAETPISDADESVRNTIRLVKDNTETVYEFIIRASSPTVTGMNMTLPQPGETVTVYGTGLQEMNKITLPGGVELTAGIVSDEDGEWFSFTMPEGVTEGGAIVAEGANGTAQTPAYFNERRGMVQDFDTAGTRGSWGSSSSMIQDDDLVADPLGLRGKVWQVVPDRLLEEGITSGKPRVTECWTVGDGDREYEDWGRMADIVPGETPLDEVALQFDIYCPDAWTGTGQIEICMINNYNYSGKGTDDDNKQSLTAFFIPWATDGTPFVTPLGWTTVTIPLSEFGKYKALLADKEATTFCTQH